MSERSLLVKSLPCIACLIHFGAGAAQCGTTEEHHLNLGGRAGQKRRGDQFSVPLGRWHHRGEPPNDMTATVARNVFGPSLARESKKFRALYGTDDELLSMTNRLLREGKIHV